ncbi:hypothetical protein [Streptomyces sp. NPDC004726]
MDGEGLAVRAEVTDVAEREPPDPLPEPDEQAVRVSGRAIDRAAPTAPIVSGHRPRP